LLICKISATKTQSRKKRDMNSDLRDLVP